MRFAVLLNFTLASTLALATVLSHAADNPYAALAGVYHGEVYNGADLDPVVTTFTLEPSGRLVGKYVVGEENGEYNGHLSNVVFGDTHTITLEWTDKFGEGFAVMEFADDFESFAGEWSSKDGTNPLPWNGKK